MPADLELFFDPVCPFCWVTSRWVEEVRARTDLRVRYRPISLRLLNPDTEDGAPMRRLHERGLELLRVAVAVGEHGGDDAVARYYGAVGAAVHEQPAPADEFADVAAEQADRPADLAGLLAATGLPPELADAAGDDRYDAAIAASTEAALARAGEDVGTPVLTFDPPDGPSFFGPVLTEVPRGDRAVELFEATRTLARHRPFTELKRSLRALPATAALSALR